MVDSDKENKIIIELCAEELQYIINFGAALYLNVPAKSLLTYCGFNIKQINKFSARMRDKLEKEGLDM